LVDSDRLNYTVQHQLKKEGFDSLITFNSIASLEAVVKGLPATVLGPNAGSFLSNTDITKIDNPRWPSLDDIKNHLFYLSFVNLRQKKWQVVLPGKILRHLQRNTIPKI
jgi:hypothetical protein